jgi:hypothetical protein
VAMVERPTTTETSPATTYQERRAASLSLSPKITRFIQSRDHLSSSFTRTTIPQSAAHLSQLTSSKLISRCIWDCRLMHSTLNATVAQRRIIAKNGTPGTKDDGDQVVNDTAFHGKYPSDVLA